MSNDKLENNAVLHELFWELWLNLRSLRRIQFAAILSLMLISTVAEAVSVGTVVPFLAILIDPQLLLKYKFGELLLSMLHDIEGVNPLLILTIIFCLIATCSGLIRMLWLWVGNRFAFACGADVSKKIFEKTLYQKYEVHLQRNTSEIVNVVINGVNGVVFWTILPILTIINSLVLIVIIASLLFWLDPYVATISVLGFGVLYFLVTILVRGKLLRNGHLIVKQQKVVIKTLQEGLGGIRDVLLDGSQAIHLSKYVNADATLRKAYEMNNFIGGFPRAAMESFGMIVIALLAYSLIGGDNNLTSAIPMLGALAVGAQRLLPALQQAYTGWANIIGGKSTLRDVVELLNQKMLVVDRKNNTKEFRSAINFHNVSFRYLGADKSVLDCINVEINKGERVGIVGGTGGGKSTFLDLLMGLLQPTMGVIAVDNVNLAPENIGQWQSNIAHVPQNIYLLDGTISENIALGVDPADIDYGHLIKCCEVAHINKFIEQLPDGYNTLIGENGSRLSGGQRQRIGIARALYRKTSVLVFDEATSALDEDTEMNVMNALYTYNQDLTLIIVAHRLKTLSKCSRILDFTAGKCTEASLDII